MLLVEALFAGDTALRATGRPLVTLSYAQSLDGSLAARRGAPLELSSPEALRLTHQLRAAHDAILVGIGTVLADDPRLTTRLAPGTNPQPVVLDSRLRLPLGARLLQNSGAAPWLACLEGAATERVIALEARGARLLAFSPDPDGRLPLPAVLERLGEMGVRRLMVEGGAQVIAAFLAAGLVDQVIVALAPLFVGGLHVTSERLAGGPFPALRDARVERCGADVVIWGRLAR
ncbi:MAG: RibD family protein [Anaerolineales bacterium]|nr:RibD family protein [Anaerolineales bacterium]